MDARLADAIADGRLRPVLDELVRERSAAHPSAAARITEALDAVAAIDAGVAAERARLIGALAEVGVAGRAPDQVGDRPLPVLPIAVDRPDVDPAVAVIEAQGYRRLAPLAAGPWRAFVATRSWCELVAVDRRPTRVGLSWPPPRAPEPVRRLLAPHRSDLDAIALPRAMWPLYLVVRLARLPVRRALRRWRPPDLGPFLTTPDALIEPLLASADLAESDLLVDLGCGDGRILVRAVASYGCRARGVELDDELVARARRAVADAGLGDRIDIVRGDASTVRLDDADVVVAFLPVATIGHLLPSLLSRLRPGARLIVHEQERLEARPPADLRTPIFSADGITVAHRWNR